ncbi:Extracellular ribonuclease LE [Morella rubra]|uniref:Extracellular ribonuclease LE n=1 Tax=Morella rubra TaxID=262757 RepID=A0A6A1UQU6_9ROSI|nr:Extracellular ribonuclease LE [Morella rubra]
MRVLFIAACILVLAIAVWVRRVTFFSSFVDRQALSQDLILAAAYDYDYSLLSMQWPKSFCNTGQVECSQVPADFTIHGLWPQKNGQPVKCPGEPRYDDAMLKGNVSLTNTMNQIWPSLNPRKPNEKFWGDEWEKHGTCTNSVYKYTQNDYFQLTCDSHLGIVPGTSHSIYDYKNAIIESELNHIPTFQCNSDWQGTVQLLEIRFCIEQTGRHLQDCNLPITDPWCDKVDKIAFP